MSSQDKAADSPASTGKTGDVVFKTIAYAAGILILVALAAVFLFLLFQAWPLIGGDQAANTATIESFTGNRAHNFWQYVGPLVFGTVLVSALSLIIAFFISIGIALFISHYAPKKLATALSYVVDLLAAIPSVIYGLWGGLILVPAIQPVWNWFAKYLRWTYIFDGSLNDPSVADSPSRTVATVAVVLAVMILPIITSVSRDIFKQTPRLQEEAAIGLGATKWQVVSKIVLPSAFGRIATGIVLAIGRAIGETAVVLYTMGQAINLPISPLDSGRPMTVHLYLLANDGINMNAAYGTALLLMVIILTFNLFARFLSRKRR